MFKTEIFFQHVFFLNCSSSVHDGEGLSSAKSQINIQSNLSLRTPLYYGQYLWSQKCQKSHIPYLYNTDTSVKRTLGSVPLVSVLKRFDRIYFHRVCPWCYENMPIKKWLMEMSDLLLVKTPRQGQQILSVICTRLIVMARNIIT